jgi:hypothetical protein
MNYLQKNLEFASFEEGLEKLKHAVSIRDKMRGAMYWNILNDDCCEIANAIREKYGRREEIGEILGNGNYI